jgi:transposase
MEAPECPGCRRLLQRVAELEAQLLALQGQLRDFIDKTKPPPPPKPTTELPPAPAKKATGRKPGGQAGHPPHLKKLLPHERVTEVVAYIPKCCQSCDAALPENAGPNDPEPTRFQIIDLPQLTARVTEHQGHARTCPCCGEITREVIPAQVREHVFGPKLTATLSYFAGMHGVGKRGIEEIAESVFDAPIALGSVSNLERETSAALAAAYQEAKQHFAEAEIKNVDETSWTQQKKKRTLWAGVAQLVAVFMIQPRRDLAALKQFLCGKLKGILGSDRAKVYNNWPGMRQLCWAHIKRNWEKWIERGGDGARLGREWLELHRLVFELWHRYRERKCSFDEFDERIAALMLTAMDVLARGKQSENAKFAGFCTRLAKRQVSLWTFACEPGVEPTNNAAERILRRAVLWRRRSFGCHSTEGCRFVERVLTAVQTLKLQKRSVLDFLKDTIEAHRNTLPYPKLVQAG